MSAAFQDLLDLAGERFGGAVVAANDDFFGPKEIYRSFYRDAFSTGYERAFGEARRYDRTR